MSDSEVHAAEKASETLPREVPRDSEAQRGFLDRVPSAAREAPRDSEEQRGNAREKRKPFYRKKVCRFCTQKLKMNYKEPDALRRFTTESGKILPRRITGTCAKHQRGLTLEIKRARAICLLPFVAN
ncbi:30S ribosomal protein S18 [Treponema endosymbiont of Eucomonympha sp.]|uniref:30S ribosomal protein S18 n=1 Tax=Treponema endosymbiont of Eucomonympha sp. TaxID=1580831 RepID=UPI000AD4CC40|nr:30S ribosomal protein S18 [Treponema endosymbiont of Eucomonympha sp.]